MTSTEFVTDLATGSRHQLDPTIRLPAPARHTGFTVLFLKQDKARNRQFMPCRILSLWRDRLCRGRIGEAFEGSAMISVSGVSNRSTRVVALAIDE